MSAGMPEAFDWTASSSSMYSMDVASSSCPPSYQNIHRQFGRHDSVHGDQLRRYEHGSLLPGVSSLLSRCSTSQMNPSRATTVPVRGDKGRHFYQPQSQGVQASDNRTCSAQTSSGRQLKSARAVGESMQQDAGNFRRHDSKQSEYSHTRANPHEAAEVRVTLPLGARGACKRSFSGGYIAREETDSASNCNLDATMRRLPKHVVSQSTRANRSDCSGYGTSRQQQQRHHLHHQSPSLPRFQQSQQPQGKMSPPIPTTKSSRYLREMDRREILTRIARGEKQSALAKEFHVSRAAICNLNKHRDQVLSRTDENPFAKHPKKSRLAKQQLHPVATTSTITSHNQGPKPTNSSASSLHHSDLECQRSRTHGSSNSLDLEDGERLARI